MRVEAIERGFYGNALCEVGKQFTLKDKKDFSPLWMKKVPEGQETADEKPHPAARETPLTFVEFAQTHTEQGKPKAESKGKDKEKKGAEEPTGNRNVL